MSIFKKHLFAIIFTLGFTAYVLSPVWTNTKTPAKDITVDTTRFNKNLNANDADVQKSLEDLDNIKLGVDGNNLWYDINSSILYTSSLSAGTFQAGYGAFNYPSDYVVQISHSDLNDFTGNTTWMGLDVEVDASVANNVNGTNNNIYGIYAGIATPRANVTQAAFKEVGGWDYSLDILDPIKIGSSLITGNTVVNWSNKADYSFGNNNFNGTGNFTTTGKIGIGTNSPAQKLDVIGNANVSGNLKVGTGGQANYTACWKSDNSTLGKCNATQCAAAICN